MKKFLFLLTVAVLFFSCKEASSPKEAAQAFLKALYSADMTTAGNYVSSENKAVLERAKKQTSHTLTPEESFQLATLTETIDGKSASVKNGVISIPMVKEEEGWKVVLNEDLLNHIQNREEQLSAVKTKWEALLKEYEGRVLIAKEYIQYKKSLGALSPQAKTLSDRLASLAPFKEWTRESLLAYVQQQKQLDKDIDGALEPSLAANTDLTMNYFLQLSNAGDRIQAAEGDYQLMAEKAHSPVYAPLPFKTANSVQ